MDGIFYVRVLCRFNESALGESLIKLGSLVPPLEESLIRQTEIENDDIMETIQYYEGMVEAVRVRSLFYFDP